MTPELTQARVDLHAHLASWPYAFANAHGCTWGTDPRLDSVHTETVRFRARVRELEQQERSS